MNIQENHTSFKWIDILGWDDLFFKAILNIKNMGEYLGGLVG